jgi:molecular chaperone Hsp33
LPYSFLEELDSMKDVLVRAITSCGHFRAVAAVTTAVVEDLRRTHQASSVAAAALGRALTGAFLLASELKGDEKLMIQILGDGPLREIFVEASPLGAGRGYVRNPQVELPTEGGKIPVGKAVGSQGTLTLIKDLGLREPYRGVVPITSGEIGKDLAYYLSVSEQVPSAVALGVYVREDLSVGAAGGYLVQTLPGATDKEIDKVEARIRELPVPTELIRGGATPWEMLAMVLKGFALRPMEEQPLRMACRCSEDRIGGALVALGPGELESMIRAGQEVAITCEFCHAAYHFSQEALKALLKEATGRARTLH